VVAACEASGTISRRAKTRNKTFFIFHLLPFLCENCSESCGAGLSLSRIRLGAETAKQPPTFGQSELNIHLYKLYIGKGKPSRADGQGERI
jgi:hypothetical protein